MKKISCIVRPDKVDAVRLALKDSGVNDVTVAEVRDHAPQDHGTMVWRGRVCGIESSPKFEMHMIVHDEAVDAVVGAIIRTARTGVAGDGYVSVQPVEHRYNIRDGRREVS